MKIIIGDKLAYLLFNKEKHLSKIEKTKDIKVLDKKYKLYKKLSIIQGGIIIGLIAVILCLLY